MAEDIDLAAGIVGLMEADLGPEAKVGVSDLKQIVGGTSAEIWSFSGRWNDGGGVQERPLILRRAEMTDLVTGDRDAEFDLLTALDPTPVPAPRVHWFDRDGTWLERPSMIMERVPGVAERNLLMERNRNKLDVSSRVELAREIAEALAEIHRVDVATLGLPQPADAESAAVEQVDFYTDEIRRHEIEPMPELRLAEMWLRDNLPGAPARLTLVHGDYRPANVMVLDGHLSAVLDWEFAHIGDPAEDLGWYLTSYYAHEHLIEGHWSANDFVDVYERVLGAPVDRKAVRFWAVFCLYKLASMTLAAMFAFRNGDAGRLLASSPDFVIRPLLQNTLRDLTGLSA